MKTPEQIALVKQQAKLTKRFHKACADYGLIEDGDHILIGLSGGKDSLALTELLGRRARIHVPSFRVSALHVRVKERDYSTDLSYLESFCAEAGVPLIVRDVEIGTPQDLDISKSRQLNNPCFLCSWYRRKTLFNVAQELGCNKIALGHHQDDLIHTALMNLTFQGRFDTMPASLKMRKMPLTIIRPLCMIEESDIKAYAEMQGYQKQTKLCPYETDSHRTDIKRLFNEMEQINPEARFSIWRALIADNKLIEE